MLIPNHFGGSSLPLVTLENFQLLLFARLNLSNVKGELPQLLALTKPIKGGRKRR